MNKKIFITIILFASLLKAYEPSVYGAGDINSASPYGLTPTEKAVLDNKKTIQNLFNRLSELQRKIDGLTSVIEGLNKDNLELKERLVLKDRLDVQERKNSQNESNQTRQFLIELSQKVDQLTNQPLSQNNTVAYQESNYQQVTNTPLSSTRETTYNQNSETIDETYRKAVQLFSHRSYGAAKEGFEKALAQRYKEAASNYYLGEIAYYTNNFSDAIAYYKKSSEIFDDASYMDVLFLHTAISLDNSGESAQARSFYQHVIDTYPNKKSAAIARSRM